MELTIKTPDLLAATQDRLEEANREIFPNVDWSAKTGIVTRNDHKTGSRNRIKFCWTSTLAPFCSLRIIGRGDGKTPELFPINHFTRGNNGEPWDIYRFEAQLHCHGDLGEKVSTEGRASDAHWAANFPGHVTDSIRCLPPTTSPMMMLSNAAGAMEAQSFFKMFDDAGKASQDRMLELTLADGQMMRPWLARAAAEIYYHCQGKEIPSDTSKWDASTDWIENFCRMIGITDEVFVKWLRLYFITNSDHEAGNASAHAGLLISSTEASEMAAVCAIILALSGRRHGDAVRKARAFLKKQFPALGSLDAAELAEKMRALKEADSTFRWSGLGHGVLQVLDERWWEQVCFAKENNLHNTEMFQFMLRVAQVGSQVYSKPEKGIYPNVDLASGVIHEQFFDDHKQLVSFYSVLFALARAIGGRAQTAAIRGLGLPIERVFTDSIAEYMIGDLSRQPELDLASL